MSREFPRHESSAIHTLRTTALPELLTGWGIVFVSSLLMLHDAFDLFTDVLVKTANWYFAVAANLLCLAIGLAILARRLPLRMSLIALLALFAGCGITEIVLMTRAPVPAPAPDAFVDLHGLDRGVAGGSQILVLGDERLGELEENFDALAASGYAVRLQARPGWSTADQLADLETLDPAVAPDLLVLVWNHDDPDVDGVRFVDLTWQNARRFAPAHLLFPRTWDFCTRHLNRFLERHVLSGYGEENWRRRLYDSDNLKAYGVVVERLAALVRERGWRTVVIVLPIDAAADLRVDRALALFDLAGLEVFDPRRHAPETLAILLRERLAQNEEPR